jgi:hypothetical protein
VQVEVEVRPWLRKKTPSRGPVQVNIFDLLGKQVASLMNQVAEPGKQELVWRREDHEEAGVYICQIRSDEGKF